MRIGRFRRILFPPRCGACDQVLSPDEEGFCRGCNDLVIRVTKNCCVKCGRTLTDETKALCDDCRSKKHLFSEGRSVYVYDGPMREAMYRFKYSGRYSAAEAFARDALDLWGSWFEGMGFDMIVPVPMYPAKERRRGFNQAGVFAKALSAETGIPVREALERVRKTPPMKGLSPEERRKNLKNAFQADDFVVKSKKVLMCDDIYTTGATMDAATGALLGAGAVKVCGIFICTGE